MGFLDNSGNIILDAVLTEAGRERLAKGDGSFKVARFALGDDEIDYQLYTPVTASGYQDLRILQLPIFEAFTNQSAALKNKLLSIENDTLLYLPVIKLNNKTRFGAATATTPGPIGGYYVSVDAATTTQIGDNQSGYRYSDEASVASNSSQLVFDQGLDTVERTLNYLSNQDDALLETQYMIEIDNRLLRLATPAGGNAVAAPINVDDDHIATYTFTLGADAEYFAAQPGGYGAGREAGMDDTVPFVINDLGPNATQEGSVIGNQTRGVLGSRLAVRLKSSLDIETGTQLFTDLGGTVTITAQDYRFIDTTMRITGAKTGYRVSVPLKLLKKI